MVVDYSNLNLIQQVGSGGYASVYFGKHDNNPVAIKKLLTEKKEYTTSHYFSEFRREVCFLRFFVIIYLFFSFFFQVSLMAGLEHSNIVRLIGLCKNPLCLITEFCCYGDLFTYIRSRRERNLFFPIEYIVTVLIDIARGMKFLHTAVPPILHRDLKSPNILLCKISPDEKYLKDKFPILDILQQEELDTSITAKVADFGLSLRTFVPVTARVVDNPLWLAPELLSNQPYSW